MVTDGSGRNLLLCPRGKPALKGFEKNKVVEIPVRRAALNNTIYAAMLRTLQAFDSIAGICLGGMGKTDTSFRDIREGVTSGRIMYLGNGNPVDYERLKVLAPDVVFARDWNRKLIPMLDSMGIPVAEVDFFQESHPLAQMEWIRFVAAFYDREEEAELYFKKAEERINAITARTARAARRPKVLSGGFYFNKVNVPKAGSCMTRMFDIGGGDYVFTNPMAAEYMAGYVTISLEAFYAGAREADVYIMETAGNRGVASIRELRETAKIKLDIKPVRSGNVWVTLPVYWESLDRKDDITADIAAILHPELFPDHRFRYFSRLPAE